MVDNKLLDSFSLSLPGPSGFIPGASGRSPAMRGFPSRLTGDGLDTGILISGVRGPPGPSGVGRSPGRIPGRCRRPAVGVCGVFGPDTIFWMFWTSWFLAMSAGSDCVGVESPYNRKYNITIK